MLHLLISPPSSIVRMASNRSGSKLPDLSLPPPCSTSLHSYSIAAWDFSCPRASPYTCLHKTAYPTSPPNSRSDRCPLEVFSRPLRWQPLAPPCCRWQTASLPLLPSASPDHSTLNTPRPPPLSVVVPSANLRSTPAVALLYLWFSVLISISDGGLCQMPVSKGLPWSCHCVTLSRKSMRFVVDDRLCLNPG